MGQSCCTQQAACKEELLVLENQKELIVRKELSVTALSDDELVVVEEAEVCESAPTPWVETPPRSSALKHSSSTTFPLDSVVVAFITETRSRVEWHDGSTLDGSWQDISKPTAQVFYKKKSNPPSDIACLKLRSLDQVPTLPLLDATDGRIERGVIPTVTAIAFWHLWFPFCQSTKILKQFSPACFIVQVVLKVLFLAVDFILFIHIEDKLLLDGTCEILMRSPPTGSEGKQWCGIVVPPKVGSLPRLCVHMGQTLIWPLTETACIATQYIDLEDVGYAPYWLKVMAFQQLALRLIPELVKFQSKFAGSPLDHYLNGGPGVERADENYLAFLLKLHANVLRTVAERAKL